MNVWLIAATILLGGLLPCAVVCLRGEVTDRLVGVEASGMIVTLVLLLLAEGFHRSAYFDLAVTLALMSFGGGLVFAHLLERWV